MPATFKPNGPPGTVRPFTPQIGEDDSGERIARALEHIAVSLAALDHNVEVLVNSMKTRTF